MRRRLPCPADHTKERTFVQDTVPSDGKCFYHAVSRALRGRVSYEHVRRRVVEDLSRRMRSPLHTRAFYRARDYGTWAETEEVCAAARSLACRILIYEQDNARWISFGDDDEGPTIHLYHASEHFSPLLP